MDLISRQTRIAFREHLVGWTLGTIRDLFDGADVSFVDAPLAQPLNGERRTLVEKYYAGIDWSSARDVRKVLKAYEEILARLTEPTAGLYVDAEAQQRVLDRLTRLLSRDGYVFENGHLQPSHRLDLAATAASRHIDGSVLREHLTRIEQSIDADPSLAIGSAKELIESVAKQIVEHHGASADRYDSVQQIVKEAMKLLNLTAEQIPDAARGAGAIKQVLAGLSQIVGGTAELRNLYGTGHGRTRASALTARHARLVVGATATLCRFLLETLDERKAMKQS